MKIVCPSLDKTGEKEKNIPRAGRGGLNKMWISVLHTTSNRTFENYSVKGK